MTRIKIIKDKTEFIEDDINEFFDSLDAEFGENMTNPYWELLDIKIDHWKDEEHSMATLTYKVKR